MPSAGRRPRRLAPLVGLLLLAVLLAVAALAAWKALAPPARQSTGDLRLHQLDRGVHVYRGLVSNSGVVVLKTGVLVVDTQVSELAARGLRERIRAITPLPVRWVVNTHHHLDHCGGNAFFAAEGAEIFAAEATRKLLAERPGEADAYARAFALPVAGRLPSCAPPTRTFAGKLEMSLDGEEVRLLQLGATETPDSTAVWIPRLRALFAGDGVSGADYPALGVPTEDDGLHDDGAWSGFLAAALELRPRILVPGHGDAFDDEVDAGRRLQQLYDLFEILLAATRREVARGTSFPALLERVGEHVNGFRRRDGFEEVWTGQDQAVLRTWNSVLRRRRGYWEDFGPRALPQPDPARLAKEIKGTGPGAARVLARALELPGRDWTIAVGLLDAELAGQPREPGAGPRPSDRERADLLGAKAALCLLALREVRPLQAASVELAAAERATAEALALDPAQPLALFARGGALLASALAFGQPTGEARAALRAALAGGLPSRQASAAHFLLGKAAFVEGERAEEDRELSASLPGPWRWAYPLLRRRLERFP
jgi:glyoxylase-like metal-dependent hydrolase (beta-lactamase superfamily II)